jgi:membrane protein DedA with SNARE-associated domain
MNEFVLGLVTTYGLLMIGVATFLSCLALPIPASLVMLAGGAFVASGDLALWGVLASAFAGAVAGDQVGFRAARSGRRAIEALSSRRPAHAKALAHAQRLVEEWGTAGVFFSRWLVSPLGPWVNLAAGAGGMNPIRFAASGGLGEAIWVGAYVGLGYVFASNVEALSPILGNAVAAVTAAVIAAVIALSLFRAASLRH